MNETPGLALLRRLARLVPAAHRAEWLAEWEGEAAHAWSAGAARPSAERPSTERPSAWRLRLRCLGAVSDALWMRRRHRPPARNHSMLSHDLRFAARALRRTPAFTAVVVTVLALCIGAGTAIFSVVDAVLLRGLPYRDVDGLVAVWSNDTRNARERNEVSVGDYRDYRARARTLASVAAYFPTWNATFTAPGIAERLDVGVVSANFLRTLGATPLLGRDFVDAEDTPGAPRTVILSHGFWQRQYGGDSAIVGRALLLDGNSYTVAGVMDERFVFPGARVDLLAPLPMLGSFLDRRQVHIVSLLARLRPGSTVESARAELSSIATALEREHPAENGGFGATTIPLRTALLGDVSRPLTVLFGAVSLVLLIGCANVANLMLVRAASRRRELAVRAALGAEPWLLARQPLVESALVSLVAGALGALIAVAATSLLARALPDSIARVATVRPSLGMFLFSCGVTTLSALLCGALPAWQGAHGDNADGLREASRGTATRAHRRLHSALVVSELALSLTLVVAASLLITSFARLSSVSPGFRTENLMRLKLSLSGDAYNSPGARNRLLLALMDRARAIPGVQEVGAVTRFPLHDNNVTTSVRAEGRALATGQLPDADSRSVYGDYFRAMAIPVAEGSVFSGAERADSGAVPVVVLNRTAARTLFDGVSAVGRRVQLGGDSTGPWFTVVGVVDDVKDPSLREPSRPQLFMSGLQTFPRTVSITVHHDGRPGVARQIAHGVRTGLAALDPALPLFEVATIEETLAKATFADRFTMALLSSFSLLALLLAALGTYGVVAFSVAQRRRELGVRVALGATSSRVRAMVLREGATLLLVAIPLGLGGAWGASRLLRGLLFGTTTADPAAIAIALGTLVIATLAACWIPARRAARTEPMVALTGE